MLRNSDSVLVECPIVSMVIASLLCVSLFLGGCSFVGCSTTFFILPRFFIGSGVSKVCAAAEFAKKL